jgi:hypothetical protein
MVDQDNNGKGEAHVALTDKQFKELLHLARSKLTREDIEEILK